MINSKDISVVVQGPVGELKNIKESLKSIRKFLPNAQIILSTWEGSDIEDLDFDKLVLSKDPKSHYCDKNKQIFYNINRQLISTQNGLSAVKTKYAIKLRSDLYFTKNDFLLVFDKYNKRDEKYSFFKHRIIVSSLTSKIYSDSPKNSYPLPFHVSDWFFFGLTEDIKDYFNIPMLNEEQASDFTCIKDKIPVDIYTFQFAPEQYFCLFWAKKYCNIDFIDWSDWNTVNIEQSSKILANNFIFLDTIQHGLYSKKHFDFINRNDGELFDFQGYISYLKFLEMYKKYCDPTFIIPTYLYYTRYAFYNETVKRIRKYKLKEELKPFIKIKKYLFIFILLLFKVFIKIFSWINLIKTKLINKNYINIKLYKKINVLSRTACLGNAVIGSIENFKTINNFQKNRIDCIVNFNIKPNERIDYGEAVKQISTELTSDIKNMLEENFKSQQIDFFSSLKPDVIIIDSFSELADKKFVNKQNRNSFYAYYSDVKNDDNFKNNYVCEGFIDINKIEEYYDMFMQTVNKTWGNIPVFYIHFPSKYETRKLYLERAEKILIIIDKISEKYKNFYSIKLENNDVYLNEDGFTYHFDKKTVKNVITEIKKYVFIKEK